MKPLISICVVLILFQSLFSSHLVKHELPLLCADKWEQTLLHKESILDPFLMPDNGGIHQNVQSRQQCLSFEFHKLFAFRNNVLIPGVNDIAYNRSTRINYTSTPVFILNGILRL